MSDVTWLVVVGAYLLGSIPTGVILARAKGIDLTTVGSGNIGATNAARALGRGLGALVLLGDAGKGFGAAIAARLVLADERWIGFAGLAAVLGHVFPVWLRFRGGKGVATTLGVVLALVPWAGAAGAAAYALVYAKTRISSVGSLAGALVAALATPFFTASTPLRALVAALFLVILARHAENVRRLLRGEESRV
jgi:glycerol-3-phosphate acyltransferase PlsY